MGLNLRGCGLAVLVCNLNDVLNFRQKLGGGNQSESVLVQNLANGLALEFECSDPTRRLRLLLSELLLVMAQVRFTFVQKIIEYKHGKPKVSAFFPTTFLLSIKK